MIGLRLCCGWVCVLSSLPRLPASWVWLFRFSVGFCFSVCFVARVVRQTSCLFQVCRYKFCGLGCLPAVPGFFRLPGFSSGGKVRSSLGSAFPSHRGKPSSLGGWLFGLGYFSWPNKSVKGTRRPLAVLKFCFYQGSAASFRFR